MAELDHFELEEIISVTWDGKKWIPTQKLIDGTRYFEFSKWEHKVVHFMTMDNLDLRKGRMSSSVDCQYIDDIYALRQIACNEALAKALHPTEHVAGEPLPKRHKRNQVVATAKDAHLVPLTLPIVLPAVADLPELHTTTLYEGVKTGQMWLPLEKPVLQQLRVGIKNCEVKPRKERSLRSTKQEG